MKADLNPKLAEDGSYFAILEILNEHASSCTCEAKDAKAELVSLLTQIKEAREIVEYAAHIKDYADTSLGLIQDIATNYLHRYKGD